MVGSEHQPQGVTALWTHEERQDRWVRQNLAGMGEPLAPEIKFSLPDERTGQATLELYTLKVTDADFLSTAMMGTMRPSLSRMLHRTSEPPNDKNKNHNVKRPESDSKQDDDAAEKQAEEKAEKQEEKKGAKKKEPYLARFQYNVCDHSMVSYTIMLYGHGYYAFEQPKF